MKGYRIIFLWMACWLVSAAMLAEDRLPEEAADLPIIEVKADRTMIYPQRMDLTGEETLADMLQIMPDLMIGGFEELISSYNLRIDNVPFNGDVRLILSQMKAKDIAKIQVCTNTGVAKGTIGMGRVLDVTMAMPDRVKGFVEGQGGFGKEIEGSGTVNVLYGSARTDIYANAAYQYQQGHEEYLTLHMTNRFDERNKLLTYLTQQYLALPRGHTQKIMGRARYFHTFNEAGTELLVLLVLIISLQNLLAVGITRLMGVDSLLGIAAGSVSMTGGHGTAGGFAEVLEKMGLQSAGTIGMAAATFGLIAGSMVGGPMAELIIRKKLTQEQMQPKDEEIDPAMAGIESDEASPEGRAKRISSNEQEFQQYAKACYWILLAMAGGTLLSWGLAQTGVTFPAYFGSLILAAIIRNVIGFIPIKDEGKWVKADKWLDMDRIISVGNICLSLFLGIAMISLKLWELKNLALPLVVILVAQVLMMVMFVLFVAYPMLGRNYDAAVLCAGICGFGLGATPNAMANMSAVCYKYHYTVKPFLIIPIIGAIFTDLINTGIITLFLNLLK